MLKAIPIVVLAAVTTAGFSTATMAQGMDNSAGGGSMSAGGMSNGAMGDKSSMGGKSMMKKSKMHKHHGSMKSRSMGSGM